MFRQICFFWNRLPISCHSSLCLYSLAVSKNEFFDWDIICVIPETYQLPLFDDCICDPLKSEAQLASSPVSVRHNDCTSLGLTALIFPGISFLLRCIAQFSYIQDCFNWSWGRQLRVLSVADITDRNAEIRALEGKLLVLNPLLCRALKVSFSSLD